MTPISVALCTYNGARFLREQLDSVLAQTLPAAEIVVTDDGSTDETQAIIEDYARSAAVPILFHANPERLGYRLNFMKAMSLCRSPVIALCDQDDVWSATKLERLAPFFEDPAVLLVHHAYDLIDDAGQVIGRSNDQGDRRLAPLSQPPTWNNPPGFSMLVRSVLLDFADVYPLSVCKSDGRSIAGHDQWLYYLASCFGTIVGTSDILAGYRQHAANVFGEGQGSPDRAAEIAGLARSVLVLKGFSRCLAQASRSPWPVDPAIRAVDRFSEHLAARVEVLSAPSRSVRFASYARLLASGAYLKGAWRLGRRNLIQDALHVI